MRFKLYFLAMNCFLFVSDLKSQSGCPDSLAQNFDPSAQINDGACVYPYTLFSLQSVSTLPMTLQEISGLASNGDKWWSHNDGADNAIFYQIQPENGQILQNATLESAANKDWEEVTTTPENLLIGDFGNNYNDRLDLGIYSVPLNEIGAANEIVIPQSAWNFIPFSYPDQTDFSTVPRDSTTHDCEAMFWRNGKIHLFTKNWKTYQTNHYTLDPATGVTTLLESFDTQGLVTGAAISPDSQLVVLLCYDIKNQYSAFSWLLWDWPDPAGDMMFSGNKRRIDFGSIIFNGQVEGIAFKDNRSGYISNERSSGGGVVFAVQSIKSFDFSEWVPDEKLSGVTENPEENIWQISPVLFSDYILINADNNQSGTAFTICDMNGVPMYSSLFTGSATRIDTRDWLPGFYIVFYKSDIGISSRKLFKIK